MESLKIWLQDWSDACVYAKECAPDLATFPVSEPLTGLLAIAAVCFLAWLVNERALRARFSPASAPSAQAPRKLVAKKAIGVGQRLSVELTKRAA